MDNSLQKIIDLRVEKTIKALEKNYMKGYYVKSTDELIKLIDSLIENDKLITAGGSMTLSETGVISHLNEKYPDVFADRAKCNNQDEIEEVFKRFREAGIKYE